MKHPFSIKHHPESQGLTDLTDLEKEAVSGGLRFTTLAVGEEGGVSSLPAKEEGGIITTMALGEEGGLPPPLM